jgi:ribonucleotide reductase beta subunit family protein with ferritin-like domain
MSDGVQLNDPQTLYRRWEESQWSPYEIDFATDQQQWPALSPDQQGLIHFVLSSLMVAEERITTKFGLTSFQFITDYLNDSELLPGFVEGYSKIHHDETRHIGYGVWSMRETVRDHPEQADTIRQTLRELLPHAADSLKLPSDGDASELLGINENDLRTFALSGLTRRLSIIGVPIETVLS